MILRPCVRALRSRSNSCLCPAPYTQRIYSYLYHIVVHRLSSVIKRVIVSDRQCSLSGDNNVHLSSVKVICWYLFCICSHTNHSFKYVTTMYAAFIYFDILYVLYSFFVIVYINRCKLPVSLIAVIPSPFINVFSVGYVIGAFFFLMSSINTVQWFESVKFWG